MRIERSYEDREKIATASARVNDALARCELGNLSLEVTAIDGEMSRVQILEDGAHLTGMLIPPVQVPKWRSIVLAANLCSTVRSISEKERLLAEARDDSTVIE